MIGRVLCCAVAVAVTPVECRGGMGNSLRRAEESPEFVPFNSLGVAYARHEDYRERLRLARGKLEFPARIAQAIAEIRTEMQDVQQRRQVEVICDEALNTLERGAAAAEKSLHPDTKNKIGKLMDDLCDLMAGPRELRPAVTFRPLQKLLEVFQANNGVYEYQRNLQEDLRHVSFVRLLKHAGQRLRTTLVTWLRKEEDRQGASV